jgi:hypothetical protein
MKPTIRIEDIDRLRRDQAIDDAELRGQIRVLLPGHLVRLTFLPGSDEVPPEMLLVRVTSIRGTVYRGRIAQDPSSRLVDLPRGRLVRFARAHIHSVVKGRVHRDH